MKLAAFVTTLFSVGALAAPSPTDSAGGTTHAAEWLVEVSPGHTIRVNGTIQDVHAALIKDDPHYNIETAAHRAAAAAAGVPVAIQKRETDFGGGSYYCGGIWQYHSLDHYWDGIDYLRSIRGQVHLRASGCDRVSCSYGAAVYMCNDGREERWLDSWDMIADGVTYLINWCTRPARSPTGPEVAGQLFHPDNWNIIVRHDDC